MKFRKKNRNMEEKNEMPEHETAETMETNPSEETVAESVTETAEDPRIAEIKAENEALKAEIEKYLKGTFASQN